MQAWNVQLLAPADTPCEYTGSADAVNRLAMRTQTVDAHAAPPGPAAGSGAPKAQHPQVSRCFAASLHLSPTICCIVGWDCVCCVTLGPSLAPGWRGYGGQVGPSRTAAQDEPPQPWPRPALSLSKGRKPCIHCPLRRFATRAGAKCRLCMKPDVLYRFDHIAGVQ
jgi:hypothetical protein